MKFFSVVFISALCLGVGNATVLGILRDFSPIISDLADSITHVLKDAGGLIGHTFSSLDEIVANAEDSIVKFNKEIEEILLGSPRDSHHQKCASQLRTVAQSVNTTVVRVCVDQVEIRNTLSERLVEISKLKSQCMSAFSKCLQTPPVDQCIKSQVDLIKSGIQEHEVTLQRDAQSITTEVTKCVETRSQQVCGTLQNAIDDYRRCCGDH